MSLPPFPYKQEEELIRSSPLERSEKAPPPPPQEDGLWIFVREDGEKLLPLGLEEMEMGLVVMKGEGEEGAEGVEGEFEARPMSFLALRTTE